MLDGICFVICSPLNAFFLLISRFLTSKYINYTYPVPVQTVNKPSTPYCLFLTVENVPLTFGFVLWLWKNHTHLFSNFETSKYLRWRVVCCLFPSKYVISALLWLTCSCIQQRLSCCSLHCQYTKHSLLFVFNGSKCSINLWCCSSVLKNPTVPLFLLSKL